MSQHIPYSRRNQEPIYIGFDKPRRINGLGIVGFVFSILGVLTFGILSPVGLFFSLLGLVRSPRGFAATGALLGLLGTSFWALLIYAVVHADHSRAMQAEISRGRQATVQQIEEVNKQISEFTMQNEGKLPDEIEGNRLAVQHQDAWGQELQYQPTKQGCVILSAGPDKKFQTRDDVSKAFAYEVKQSNRQYLIEL